MLPTTPARIHLGIVLRQQNAYAAALASLHAAVALDPANALAQFEYGRTLATVRQDESAMPHLEQAIKLDPTLPGVQNELAMALQRLGRQQEAIPWFQQAIRREPGDISALTNLGLALTLSGNANEGLTYLKPRPSRRTQGRQHLQGPRRSPRATLCLRRSHLRLPGCAGPRSRRPAASLRSRPGLQIQRPRRRRHQRTDPGRPDGPPRSKILPTHSASFICKPANWTKPPPN